MDKESAFYTMNSTLENAGITKTDNIELYNFIQDMFFSGFYFGYNCAVSELNQFTVNQQGSLDLEFGLSKSTPTEVK